MELEFSLPCSEESIIGP